jgi:anti-anti-sigma factor
MRLNVRASRGLNFPDRRARTWTDRAAGVFTRRIVYQQRLSQPDYLSVVTTASDAHHARLTIAGELDAISGDHFADALRAHLRRGRRYLTVDLAALTFLDAAGIGAMLRAHQDFLGGHGRLLFCNVPARVMRLLTLVDVADELFLVDGEHRSLGIAT